MMAEDRGGDEIFVYTGGDQVVPDDVVRVRIDKSVKIIPREAFQGRRHLIDVEFHDGIERIEKYAFFCCGSLRSVKLLGVKIIETRAFESCVDLIDVEFDKLETIEQWAFNYCRSLRSLTIPSVRSIDRGAFNNCVQITDLEFGEHWRQ
mmetsp:Transcript_30503/g.61213  ORF Transcript_30503/g.61213 Transcript_30503/m.61213 type:complete len:149 (+) Transcript_30503:102-548(+)